MSLGFPCGLPRGRGLSSVPRGPGCRQGTAVPLHPGCVGSLCPGAGVVSGARGCRDVRWWLRSSPAGMRGPWEVRDSEGCWAQPTRAGRRGGGARGGECFCPRYAAGDFGVEQRHALGSGRARSLLGPSPAPHRGAARRLCGGDGRPARHRRRPAGPGHTAPRRATPPAPAPAEAGLRSAGGGGAAVGARHPRDRGANQGTVLALPGRLRPPPPGQGEVRRGKSSAAAVARGRLAAPHGDRELLQRGRPRPLLGERRDGAVGSRLGGGCRRRHRGMARSLVGRGWSRAAGPGRSPRGLLPAAGEREPPVPGRIPLGRARGAAARPCANPARRGGVRA